jgi:hypothetical protein
VIGIDPGKTTGMFTYSPGGEGSWYEFGAEEAPRVLHNTITDRTHTYGASGVFIAVERFIINARTAKSTQQTDALEVTGMVKGFAALLTPNPVRQYMKANLRFANDVGLRKAGWYSPKMGHATDAARQAYALLKDVHYPSWLDVANGAMMKIDDETKGQR